MFCLPKTAWPPTLRALGDRQGELYERADPGEFSFRGERFGEGQAGFRERPLPRLGDAEQHHGPKREIGSDGRTEVGWVAVAPVFSLRKRVRSHAAG